MKRKSVIARWDLGEAQSKTGGDPFAPIVGALCHPDPMVRKSMARYLAGRIPARHVPRLIERLLSEKHPDVIKWLALGVALTRRPLALKALLQKRPQVSDEMALDWIDASIAVTKPPCPRRVRDLVSSGEADARQEGTIMAWGQEGLDEETTARLVRQLQDTRPKIRRWASLALYRHHSLSQPNLVVHNLEDHDYRLREWTAHVLSPLASLEALPLLIDMFERDPAPRVREWAARALANYNDQDVRELLYERYAEELDPFVREAIVIGIARGPKMSGDCRFLARAMQMETSAVVVGELLRTIVASPAMAADDALMAEAESTAVRLSKGLNLPRLYARGLAETAASEDLHAVARVRSSPVARLLMSALAPGANGENVNPTIAIVVALHEEFDCVFNELRSRGIRLSPVVDDQKTGRLVYQGTHDSSTGVRSYLRVVVLGDKGPIASAIETTRLMLTTTPDLLAVLGIAGGLSEDVALADVVVGTVVDNYIENTKAVTSSGGNYGFLCAGEPFRSDALLVDRARNLRYLQPDLLSVVEEARARVVDAIPAAELTELRATGLLKDFSLVAGPIASGPIVGASTPFAEWLLNHRRDYMAMEMESGAAAASTYMIGGLSSTRFIAVRGISDFADERKKKLDQIDKGGIRRAATVVALAALLALVDVSTDLIGDHRASRL